MTYDTAETKALRLAMAAGRGAQECGCKGGTPHPFGLPSKADRQRGSEAVRGKVMQRVTSPKKVVHVVHLNMTLHKEGRGYYVAKVGVLMRKLSEVPSMLRAISAILRICSSLGPFATSNG